MKLNLNGVSTFRYDWRLVSYGIVPVLHHVIHCNSTNATKQLRYRRSTKQDILVTLIVWLGRSSS
jgi:hypothetical protein